MSDFVEGVTKALALELDRKITGKPNEVSEVNDATPIVLEYPVITFSVDDDTFHGLSLDMFWFDEWADYEGEEY